MRNGVVITNTNRRRAHLKQQHLLITDERERDAHKTDDNDEKKDIYSSAYLLHLTPQNKVPRSHMRSSIPARFYSFLFKTIVQKE